MLTLFNPSNSFNQLNWELLNADGNTFSLSLPPSLQSLGISLTKEQWETLKTHMDEIDDAIEIEMN
jgi:hypothetical protein